MNNEMVAPSQLHRDLERARDAGGEQRSDILASTLHSQNLAVIRKIPEVLSPLSGDEKEVVAQWAEELTQDKDVSRRDFAFHLLVNSEVPTKRILAILEQNKTFSRCVLEHIQQMLQANGQIQQLDSYFCEVAETLLDGKEISPRDRGRHILMTLAHTEDDWKSLAHRFSETEISDLRQRVLERFLQECPDGVALTLFVDNVVKMCLDCVHGAAKEDIHKEVPHIHWVLMCLKRVGWKKELSQAVSLFKGKFGTALPYSVRYKIEDLFPQVQPQACSAASIVRELQPPRETNAKIAARLGVSKRQVVKMRARGKLP